MKHYMGVKLIQAEPMSENQYREAEGRPLVGNDRTGYVVIYPDGYKSWSPAGEFERAYLALESADKVTPNVIQSIVANIKTEKVGEKTALCRFELVTGFEIYATSSCVSPENYDPIIGQNVAGKEIQDKIWFAMGFLLQWAKYGLTARNKGE